MENEEPTKEELEAIQLLEDECKKKTTVELVENLHAFEVDPDGDEYQITLHEIANRPPFNNLRLANVDLENRIAHLEDVFAKHKHTRDGSAALPFELSGE